MERPDEDERTPDALPIERPPGQSFIEVSPDGETRIVVEGEGTTDGE